jgi:hypothetical protein
MERPQGPAVGRASAAFHDVPIVYKLLPDEISDSSFLITPKLSTLDEQLSTWTYRWVQSLMSSKYCKADNGTHGTSLDVCSVQNQASILLTMTGCWAHSR